MRHHAVPREPGFPEIRQIPPTWRHVPRAISLCQGVNSTQEADSAPYSLASESRFPETETAAGRRPVRLSRFRRSEAQHLVLARPFGRHVAETRYSHATR